MANHDTRASSSPGRDISSEAVRYSKDFVHHLWARDISWCLNRTASDFVWIGSRNDQFAQSQQEFSTMFDSLASADTRASVTNEEYTVVSTDDRYIAIAGRFLTLTPTDNQHINAQWYRCTLMWKRMGGKLLLSHLHMSAPIDDDGSEEGYPITAGTETYRYMKSLMRLGSSRKNISLYDVDGTVHWIHPSQIVYLKANRKRTIVHCMTKDIVVPAVIRDTVEMVGNKVMRVHRSFAVNRDHVVELTGTRLVLDDGTTISIPAKRLPDVKAELMGD